MNAKASGASSLSPLVDHVVIIIKENHTYDNYFGIFPHSEDANCTAQNPPPGDPNHRHETWIKRATDQRYRVQYSEGISPNIALQLDAKESIRFEIISACTAESRTHLGNYGGYAFHYFRELAALPGNHTRVRLRIPCVVISPYAREGYVSPRQRSHISLVKFCQTLLGIESVNQRPDTADGEVAL